MSFAYAFSWYAKKFTVEYVAFNPFVYNVKKGQT